MKTITFYSYKGGVGRSLALSNMAMRLSEFKKKVCVMDFDLEAPGLEYKFRNYIRGGSTGVGLVEYIHKFACNKNLPTNISDYTQSLTTGNNQIPSITFIGAGNYVQPDYWKKLSEIHWNELFYENGDGVRFFIDLKAKIEKELTPDFLLIDSRTGITDISGITLRLFADDVVILAANNQESLLGSGMVINTIANNKHSLFGRNPKIHFVLTRLPFTIEDRIKENQIITQTKGFLKLKTKLDFNDILVIHSDRRLEENERPMIADETEIETEKVSISKDYLKLFDVITQDILTTSEKENYLKLQEAIRLLNKALRESDIHKKIDLLSKAIDLNAYMPDAYIFRGERLLELMKYNEALENYLALAEIIPNTPAVVTLIGFCNYKLGKFQEANKYYDESISIFPGYYVPYMHKAIVLEKQGKIEDAIDILTHYIKSNSLGVAPDILNTRADFYRKTGNLAKAYEDIQQAINISPKTGLYFATLAEICATDEKTEEFYLNLNLALSNGISVESLKGAFTVYEKFRNEPRFIELLERYGKDVNELFDK
jgi:tetratricopeptide (TPR) repeat protein